MAWRPPAPPDFQLPTEGGKLPGRAMSRIRIAYGADVWTAACERAADLLTNFDHVYVAFSGGKDSSATLNTLLHVAHSDPRFERHLPLRAVFWDEEALPYETEDYVRRVAQRDDVQLEWMCLPVQHRNACSRRHPYWWPWAPESEALWCRPMPPEAITEWPGFPLWPAEARLTIPAANGLFTRLPGNCAVAMGIRAQESLIRMNAVMRKEHDNWIIKYDGPTSAGNLWKAYLVYDWSDNDVWTAPARFGWDYNRAYDRQEMAGRTVHQQRCSPAFGEEPLEQLHVWAQAFPDVWEKMTERVPGVGAAYRYALTELWGRSNRPVKPAGMSWPDFILHYLRKFEPPVQRQLSRRIAMLIRGHYRKTTDPILPRGIHPETGCDWDFFLTVAMRGDFKERRQPSHKASLDSDGRRPVKDWHRYAAELRRCLDEGITPDELGYPRPLPADPWALVPEYARGEDDT